MSERAQCGNTIESGDGDRWRCGLDYGHEGTVHECKIVWHDPPGQTATQASHRIDDGVYRFVDVEVVAADPRLVTP